MTFAASGERHDALVARATALSLATSLGMDVQEHRVTTVAGRPALAVRPVIEADGSGVFAQRLTAASAMGLSDSVQQGERRNSYVSVALLMNDLADRKEVFRRALLHAAVGDGRHNLWNTWLLKSPDGALRLEPLHDVLPDPRRQGLPILGMSLQAYGERVATIASMLGAGKEVAGLPPAVAFDLVTKTLSTVQKRWQEFFLLHAKLVPKSQADVWERAFAPEPHKPVSL